MDIFKDKEKRKGLITTVVVHVVLIILFSIFGLSYIEPTPEEGITINFGFDDAGMNDFQNETPSETNEDAPTETITAEPEPVEQVEDEIITQDAEDAPSIDDKKEEPKEEIKTIEMPKEEAKPDKNLSNALDKWKNKKNDQGGGDGNTGEVGDQGSLEGKKDSKSYVGGPSGNGGVGYSLAGRNMISSPPIQDDSQNEGKVVVDIIVDKYGKVLRATPGARGSTTANSQLYKKAKEAALKTKFNANPEAAEEQKGQMTFIFILN